MLRVGAEVVLGFVAAVEEVSEIEGRRPVAEERAGGEVEDGVERGQAVEAGDHGGHLRLVGVVFNLEEHDVLDGLRRRRHCYLGGEV